MQKKTKGTKVEPSFNRPIVVTKPMILEMGGIPKIHEKWRPTDNQCMYLWLPHLPNNEGSAELFDKVLDPLDKHFHKKINEDGNKDCVFSEKNGKKTFLKDLKYLSAVKEFTPDESGDADGGDDSDGSDKETNEKDKNKGKDGKKQEGYNRIKVRFACVFDKNKKGKQDDQRQIKTRVFVKNEDGSVPEDPLPIKTLADLRKQLVWKCEVQFALEINKFWAKRAKKFR